MNGRTWKRIVAEVAFAAGLAVIVWIVLHLGLQPVGQALASVGVRGVLLLALAHVPTLAVMGLSWWALARHAPGAHPLKFVWGRFLRDSGGEILPFSQVGGFVLGVRAIALGGVSGLAATVSGLLDNFAEQAAKVPYTALSVGLLLWLAPSSGLVAPAVGLLVLSVGAVVFVAFRRRWVRSRIEILAVGVLRRWPGRAEADPSEVRSAVAAELAPRGVMWPSLGLHFIAWTLGGAEAWLALHLLGAPLGIGKAMVIDGMFTAVRMLAFFVPASVGVQEGAYILLGALFGVPAPVMVAFSLVRRARDLVLGGPALIVWQMLERRARLAAPPEPAAAPSPDAERSPC